MIKFAKITLIASAVIAVSTHLSLANTNDYRLIAFKSCDVVAEQSLNQEQVESYLALQSSERRLDMLTAPVDALDDDIDNYTTQISELTNRAIQEHGDTVTIDRSLIKEQEALAKELEALVEAHESDFMALEKEARTIEAQAQRFEKAIDPLLKDTDYDTVRIVGPKYSDAPYNCDDKHAMIIM